MRTSIGLLAKVLLLPALLTCHRDGFSQESAPAPEGDSKPPLKGPAEAAPKRSLPFPRVVFSTQVVRQNRDKNHRTINATINGEKVEIKEANGTNIVLNHTRSVNGKAVTTEYKAEDFAELKAKSPEAATLYEKCMTALEPPVKPQFQFQFPANRAPAPNLAPNAPPQEVASNDEQPIEIEPRKIHIELTDRKLEIIDSVDQSILVRVIKTVEGRDLAEEFTADDLQQFKKLHPDIYQIYKKYTGRNAD